MLIDLKNMEEKIKDIFLILFVGAVFIGGYYFYQNYFGVAQNLSNPNVQIIEQAENKNLETIKSKTPTQTAKKTTTVQTQKAPLITSDGIYLIYLYKSGFYPNHLKIRRGTSVRFVNKTKSSMRIYAVDQNKGEQKQLNQSKTVGYDGTYDYAFSNTGVWLYTNYTDQNKMGSIEIF